MLSKKVVVIGDGACGKTSLSVTFSRNEFPEEHVPTVFDTYTKTISLEDQNIELAIWDTAGEEDYDRLRPLVYTKTNVVIICFAVDNPISLKNVVEKWAPEARHYCRTAQLILVATKLDLRHNETTINELKRDNLKPVDPKTGRKVAKKIQAKSYLECSAKHMMGVHDVFHKAALNVMEEPKGFFTCHCFHL